MNRFLHACVLLVLLIVQQPALAQAPRGALLAASDGQGEIRLLWIPADGAKAAAWRLEEEAGSVVRVIESRIADTTRAGARESAPTPATAEKAGIGQSFLALRIMSDWTFAQTRGLARVLRDVPAGERRYRVVALGVDGATDGETLRSRPIDSRKADPLPPVVANLRLTAVHGGAALYWQPGKAARIPPVIAWRIERDGAEATGSPLVLGETWPADRRAWVDREVALEGTVHYRVAALDVFGRTGPWSGLEAFVPDVAARDAPLGVHAVEAAGGGIRVSWEQNPSPNTAGYVPERARQRGGPYEALTLRGVPRGRGEFVDEDAPPGALLYYRVRAMDPRGDLGEPSLVAPARVPAERLQTPGELRADVGASQVVLRWDPLPAVAGYYLQRRASGTTDWVLLNDALCIEPRFDDTGLSGGGSFEYRVIAVGHDNGESGPGPALRVTLPDRNPPAAPRIVAANGENARALLRFEPAEPVGDTREVLVLRGASAGEVGLVIGDPVSGSAREWSDEWVLPGETYWYRLVALDGAGNRSEPGPAVAVRIGSGVLPEPPPPRLRRVQEPFRGVELRFDPPPQDLALMIQRRVDGLWRTVAGPVSGSLVIDPVVSADTLEYRTLFRARDGMLGPPSTAVSIAAP